MKQIKSKSLQRRNGIEQFWLKPVIKFSKPAVKKEIL